MINANCVQIWITNTHGEKLMCWVDTVAKEVYSSKMKKLKGLHHARAIYPYFIIHYEGYKVTKSLKQLLDIANEELQRKDRKVS